MGIMPRNCLEGNPYIRIKVGGAGYQSVGVDKSRLHVRRERRWFTAGESPARELVRSTR